MKPLNLKKWHPERLSRLVLYVLVGVAAVIFCLFYAFGYDRPYADDPKFNNPLFTDVVISLIVFLVIASFLVCAWALVVGIRRRDKAEAVVNGVPAAKIYYGTAVLTVVVLAVSLAVGSTSPIPLNGVKYSDAVLLKIADMFIISSISMIALALGIIALGYVKSRWKGVE